MLTAPERTGVTSDLAAPEDLATAEDLAATALTLARAFARGGTLWCVSAAWPAHAQHVAVEFVHPVIVGKRALPAVFVEGAGAARTLRLLARPGDGLLVLSSGADLVGRDLMVRSEAWGLTRIWLGSGPRPAPALADHLLWAEGVDPGRAARGGELLVLYHVLWELTHVVFEHPGLLEPPSETQEVCITCSDAGDLAEVQVVHDAQRADVLVGGVTQTIDISLVDPVGPGDLVLVHAGVGVAPVDAGASPDREGSP